MSIIIGRQHLIIQSFVSSWDSWIIVVPVLIQLVRVEVGGELRSIGGVGGEVGRGEVVDRRGTAVGGGGGRDHTKWTVKTWK